jgi:hypothetical protein
MGSGDSESKTRHALVNFYSNGHARSCVTSSRNEALITQNTKQKKGKNSAQTHHVARAAAAAATAATPTTETAAAAAAATRALF